MITKQLIEVLYIFILVGWRATYHFINRVSENEVCLGVGDHDSDQTLGQIF